MGGGHREGEQGLIKWMYRNPPSFMSCWSTLHSQLPILQSRAEKCVVMQNLYASTNCVPGHSSQLSDKYWHYLSCIRQLHFVASYFKIP